MVADWLIVSRAFVSISVIGQHVLVSRRGLNTEINPVQKSVIEFAQGLSFRPWEVNCCITHLANSARRFELARIGVILLLYGQEIGVDNILFIE